ncbi:MAG: helix-turn-helix domain-containing protein [Sciscionella sp.]
MTSPTTEQGQHVARALGHELGRIRKSLGWTRKKLLTEMRNDISSQTLATYEQGTRAISVARLIAVCAALGVWPGDVLDHAYREVLSGPSRHARISLDALATTSIPLLQPLRGWAAIRARDSSPGHTAELPLNDETLTSMADLCGTDRDQLTAALRGL